MNVVTDLAARAVSFITLIQDTLLKDSIASNKNKKLDILSIFRDEFEVKFPTCIHSCKENAEKFKIRATELVWISTKTVESTRAVQYTIKLSVALVSWICKNEEGIFKTVKSCGSVPTPYIWREAISEVLYGNYEERTALASVLQYLPVQVVLALGGGFYNAHKQRILQVWGMSLDDGDLLTADEIELSDTFYRDADEKVKTLLESDKELLDSLEQTNSPFSFELVFGKELDEIKENRDLRYQEQCLAGFNQTTEPTVKSAGGISATADPFARAGSMELFALALSGGGIRSATFNLGLLQGLAEESLLGKFDYLSTVSGGGYIGSWLAAWIKRDGSVTKVSDRLNPNKSPDPFGEELRPIRWLRMFSNYFTPNASIMSADSWTVGITWLRNTLLNQLIILLLFLSTLLSVSFFFEIWKVIKSRPENITDVRIALWSMVLILPVALLSGWGMQSYHSERFPPVALKKEETRGISVIIMLILFAGAYIVSAWLCSLAYLAPDKSPFPLYYQKLRMLGPVAIVCFFALSLIAVFGRYDRCMRAFGISAVKAWLNIIYTAALSAFIGLICLGWIWVLFEWICSTKIFPSEPDGHKKVLFIIGLPLVMEVFGITVVARMALLGRFFPDERREWWGRVGAEVHRLAFLYILFAGSSLIGKALLKNTFDAWTGVVAGGWVALVGSTVKAAFSSKSSGKGEKGSLSLFLNILAKVGPYLFVLGLLIFLPALLTPLFKLEEKAFFRLGFKKVSPILSPLILMLILLAATYRLARRVGVNEFSMHHFYRNRLVRAYLGATRRQTDRQKTANPFTGFDMQDDVKLSELTNEHGYYGPYPILNTALNASEVTTLDRQDRKAESFIFSPLYCGFDFSMTRASADTKKKSYDYGLRQTEKFAYPGGPGIGTAMAISGAAVNPNQGYHSSAATAFLLTVFNVQMGWWIGNPRKGTWREADPRFGLAYIIFNLIGKTNTKNEFVCLSDGGHFDNMGLYELVRRRCSFIILGDGEQDTKFSCEGLANAIRRCRIDFGAEIDIDLNEITKRDENRYSKSNYSIGEITYADGKKGTLLYIKSSITGKEPVDVREYSQKNPTFPHQTTADQFFDEEQFESYRKLGLHIARLALSGDKIRDKLKLRKSPADNKPEGGFRSELKIFLDKTKDFLAR